LRFVGFGVVGRDFRLFGFNGNLVEKFGIGLFGGRVLFRFGCQVLFVGFRERLDRTLDLGRFEGGRA
jgi:hypothetical protein